MKRPILIIEDESSIADNIRFALEQEGYETQWVATGGEGKARLAQGDFQLIVLDVGLPDTDGFTLCREIRRSSNIPVIFLTARSEEIDRVVGLELGADDYIVKPFSPRELAARIKAVLRRGSGETTPNTSGPFVIDAKQFQISFFGEGLELSPYEFRLLKVFLERPGRVLSRDQLMELAWEDPEASMDRTVDAHIKTLRAKMKKIKPELDPIQTHRGLGYSLKETL